jgi:hypothetical protein
MTTGDESERHLSHSGGASRGELVVVIVLALLGTAFGLVQEFLIQISFAWRSFATDGSYRANQIVAMVVGIVLPAIAVAAGMSARRRERTRSMAAMAVGIGCLLVVTAFVVVPAPEVFRRATADDATVAERQRDAELDEQLLELDGAVLGEPIKGVIVFTLEHAGVETAGKQIDENTTEGRTDSGERCETYRGTVQLDNVDGDKVEATVDEAWEALDGLRGASYEYRSGATPRLWLREARATLEYDITRSRIVARSECTVPREPGY